MRGVNAALALIVAISVASWSAAQNSGETSQGANPAAESSPRATDETPRPVERGNAGGPATEPVAPDSIQFVKDVIYAQASGSDDKPVPLKMDVMFPKQSDGKPLPVVVYVHGGGYVMGSKADGHRFTRVFAQGGYFAASIDYRLAQVAKYPAAVHDCKAAIRFIRANAEQLGIDPQRIGVWGHSAGGHLSALLGTSGNSQVMEGAVEPLGVSSAVACVVDVCGPTDFMALSKRANVAGGGDGDDGQGESFQWRWFGARIRDVVEKARQASPMTYVDAHDPPFLIVHGTADDLVPVAQSQMLHEALKAAGVEVEFLPVEGAGHAITQPEAYLTIARFFDAKLGGHALDATLQLDRPKQDTMPEAPILNRRDPS